MTDGRRVFLVDREQTDAPLNPEVVGAKAADLIRLIRLGLRVPPALVLSTAACHDYLRRGALSDDTLTELAESIHVLERATSLTFGGRRPLVVAVRSSSPASMPGMLGTVLNVGLTDATVAGLIRRTGNPWLAWDAYRRLVRSYAETVRGSTAAVYNEREAAHLARVGVSSLQELDALSLRDFARELTDLLAGMPGGALPQDPFTQLVYAIEGVLASWSSVRARDYRRLNGLNEHSGMAVLIQTMVFGNGGSRNLAFGAQGGELVSGQDPTSGDARLPTIVPEVWAELQSVKVALGRESLDMQDFEFTVEDGVLYIL